MQLIVRLYLWLGVLRVGCVASGTWQQKPTVVKPEIAIPGVWKVNKEDTLLCLPLDIPSDLPLERVKIMSNGESILVLVTARPKEQPETKAVKKFRLVLDALKQQAGYDEVLLKKHLEEWYETEEDDEVRVLVKSTLDSLKDVRDAKTHESGPPPAMSIPLGMLGKSTSRRIVKGTKSSVPFLAADNHIPIRQLNMTKPMSFIASSATATGKEHNLHEHLHTKIIKESFEVEIPFPVSAEQVFVIQTVDQDLIITMPLKRKSLEVQGISTGGKPFIPCPVYNLQGQLIGGLDEAPSLSAMAPTLSTDTFIKEGALKPLDNQ